MFALRDCQSKFITDIGLQYGAKQRRVLGVASTGFGKTVCFATIASRAAAKGKSVVIVAHRVEIINQISAALTKIGIRHGRIQPGKTRTNDLIQVAMVQTLCRRVHEMAPPDLIVIDECHHAVAKSYMDICAAWPFSKILGVTATPQLLSGKGLREAFDVMVEAIPMSELIELGYLANYKYLAPPMVADISSVKTRMGDYAVDDLAAAMDKATVIGSAVNEYRKYLSGKTAIAFCVSIDHAEHTAQQFRDAGIRAQSVDGNMDPSRRAKLIDDLGTGALDVLTNCNIATEGTDIPAVGGAILLRPTKSIALYLQMVGRCLRPKPDGSAAIIIDHVGAVHTHGLPATARQWSLDGREKRQKNEVKTKTCETCFRVFMVEPEWQKSAECGSDPVNATGCVLTNDAPAKPRVLEQVDGVLSEITESPSWAGGINVIRAAGPEFKALVSKARTREQLQEIARIRGYKPQWAHFILKQRQERAA
jgi:DNA repair protein RadD